MVLAAGWLPVLPGSAQAQSYRSSYPYVVPRDADAPWRRSVVPTSDRTTGRDESDAGNLLEDAIADLSTGRIAQGQRLLELLIARYPDGPAAADARRRLGDIYSGRGPGNGAVLPAPKGGAANGFSAGEAAAAGNWQIDIQHRNHPAEDDLRAKAGDRVFFSPGSAELGGRARTVLQAQAKWLNHFTAINIVVEGHADDPGGAEINRDLAARRALAVRERLIEEGVAESRIVTAGRSNSERVAECSDAACSAQNRRVVTLLIETAPPSPRSSAKAAPGASRLSGGSDAARTPR